MTSILESTNQQSRSSAPRSDRGVRDPNRVEFWIDTCREVNEMRLRTPQVLELYQKHGCRFVAPTRDQVQVVLDALDGAMPDWNGQHPELFYQALELNYPELVRHR
jgi:hypothetical protein